MKKIALLGLIAITCTLVACGDGGDKTSNNNSDVKTVGVFQIVEHPSLDTIRNSIIEELKNKGLENGKNINIIEDNAHGEINNLPPIIEKMISNKADVLVPITTPAAMAASKYADKLPVIFAAVSAPKQANLISDYNKPDKNITGASDEIQVAQIMDVALKLYPNTKTVGGIYNSAETNSVYNMGLLKDYCKSAGLNYIEGNVANTSEIPMVASTLLPKADMIFTPTDNTVASGIGALVSACNEAKKPLIVGADSLVNDGGLCTVGINYEDLGHSVGDMIYDVIINGKKIEDIPVKVFKDNLNILINKKTADEIGLKIPDEIKSMPNYKEVN